MIKKCFVCGREEIVGDWTTGVSHVICSPFCLVVYEEYLSEDGTGTLSLREMSDARKKTAEESIMCIGDLTGDGIGRLLSRKKGKR